MGFGNDVGGYRELAMMVMMVVMTTVVIRDLPRETLRGESGCINPMLTVILVPFFNFKLGLVPTGLDTMVAGLGGETGIIVAVPVIVVGRVVDG